MPNPNPKCTVTANCNVKTVIGIIKCVRMTGIRVLRTDGRSYFLFLPPQTSVLLVLSLEGNCQTRNQKPEHNKKQKPKNLVRPTRRHSLLLYDTQSRRHCELRRNFIKDIPYVLYDKKAENINNSMPNNGSYLSRTYLTAHCQTVDT